MVTFPPSLLSLGILCYSVFKDLFLVWWSLLNRLPHLSLARVGQGKAIWFVVFAQLNFFCLFPFQCRNFEYCILIFCFYNTWESSPQRKLSCAVNDWLLQLVFLFIPLAYLLGLWSLTSSIMGMSVFFIVKWGIIKYSTHDVCENSFAKQNCLCV